MRPETETRPEPEIDNPAEIQVFMSVICELEVWVPLNCIFPKPLVSI